MQLDPKTIEWLVMDRMMVEGSRMYGEIRKNKHAERERPTHGQKSSKRHRHTRLKFTDPW